MNGGLATRVGKRVRGSVGAADQPLALAKGRYLERSDDRMTNIPFVEYSDV